MKLKEFFNKLFKKNPNKIKESKLDIFIAVLSGIGIVFMLILVIIPVLNYFSLAFNHFAFNNDVFITPVKWSWEPIAYVFTNENYTNFWKAFLNSVIITVVVTIFSNLFAAMAAYPLSKTDCPFRGVLLMYFIITMLFSAGIVPIYLLMSGMNLLNNIWSVILISISNVGNMLLFKSFFEGLSGEVEEAAIIDGANPLQLFFKIVCPLSLPVFGSCCFFTIVGMWNGYGAALLFINSSAEEAMPLAYYLYIKMTSANVATMYDTELRDWFTNIEAASMLISIVPILLIYPYVIKYIKSGLTLGSSKG